MPNDTLGSKMRVGWCGIRFAQMANYQHFADGKVLKPWEMRFFLDKISSRVLSKILI